MKSMRKGFTLIELMIVIAIIAIIAAIAIPNLMQSRIRANEATAITTVKQYATAQVTFQVGKQGRSTDATLAGASGFADNYRNLYYAPPVGQTNPMALISQAMADAYGAAPITGSAPTFSTSKDSDGNMVPTTGTPAAYQGYYLNEPKDVTAGNFKTNFAILATPADSTSTGTNAYWVDQQGTVWMKGLGGGLKQLGNATGDNFADLGGMTTTPSSGAAAASDWSVN